MPLDLLLPMWGEPDSPPVFAAAQALATGAPAPVNLRRNEGALALPVPFWDAVWSESNGAADWALASPQETRNVGGLSATQALETAVILCLFTDAFCPPTHPLRAYVDPSDPRGWWGDGVDVRADLGEATLGSLLWTLERAVVTDRVAQLAQAAALAALSPMLMQDSIANVSVQAFGSPPRNALGIAVQLYGRDGTKIYDRRFDDVWAQFAVNGVSVRA